ELAIGQPRERLEEERAAGTWYEATHPMTPWPSVNQKIGIWGAGNLIVVSGPQSVGKTTLTLNVAAFQAAGGVPSLVYCLEMTVTELIQHILCAHYQLPEERITSEIIARRPRELA